MSFDRHQAQTLCESFLGCSNFEDFFNLSHSDVEAITLDRTNAYSLRNSLNHDARDLYFKGCQSLNECLANFNNRHYSWAIVKGYYSTFYMIKADFALREHALIRHKAIYYLKAEEGANPITKGRNGAKRTEYSGDHKSAINYYKDLFSNSDILLSQEIEGMNSYQWLMKKREQINYQERYFNEPNFPAFLTYIDGRISSGDFLNLIKEIEDDTTYRLTFQQEYAPIAIPLKRAILTKQNFINNGVSNILSPAQKDHLNTFGPFAFT